jgi:hypothetical protein
MVAEPRKAKVCRRTHQHNSFIAEDMPKTTAHLSMRREIPDPTDWLMKLTVRHEVFEVVAPSGHLVICISVPHHFCLHTSKRLIE